MSKKWILSREPSYRKSMRIRAAFVWLATVDMAVGSVGCGEEAAECSGDSFTGAPATCGMGGAFDRTVCVDGKQRAFRVYVPATVTCDVPPPLIVFLHGNGGNEGSGDVARSIADELGAVYVTPRGYDHGDHLAFGPDGIPNSRTFLTRVVDQVKSEFPTSPEFTVVTGFSGGAFFASYCIAWLYDRVAVIGVFSSGI
jgi:poly(3-hydroxybutyrate) depolymerase